MFSKPLSTLLPYFNSKENAPVALYNELVVLTNQSPLNIPEIKRACLTLLEAPFHLLSEESRAVLLRILEKNITWPDQPITAETFKDLDSVKTSLESVLVRSIYKKNIDSVLQAFCPQTLMGSILNVKRHKVGYAPSMTNKNSRLGALARELEHHLALAQKNFKLSPITIDILKQNHALLDTIWLHKQKFPYIHRLMVGNHLLIHQVAKGNCQRSESYIPDNRL